jgi:alkanesulfonate monooxygenase SsuD/methylene tetrahydromethanopterin reductase-like flavin-dependent oxidoreductase (luciferase family)
MLPVGICLATVGTSYTALRDAARALDDLAYDSIWVWDHYLSGRDPREPVLECWTTLAGLAEATRQIHLGSLVANIINHHPARLAKIAATLQELSGGRLELGIGAGGWAAEQVMVGIEQGSRAERNARLAEALQIIPALWAGDAVTYQGRYYHLTDAVVAPPPLPQPRVIVGGRSSELAALAGRYANGFNLHWHGRAMLPTVLDALDRALAEREHTRSDFDLSIHAEWPDFIVDPLAMLSEWHALGFTRAMLAVRAPFPLAQFEQLARRLQYMVVP